MSIINLERDMIWPVSLVQTTPLVSAFSGTVSVGAPAAVGQRVSSAFSTLFTTTNLGQWHALGALILPPVDGDSTPYRFRASYDGPNPCNFGYGWFDSAAMEDFVIVGSGTHLDAVVAVSPLDSADPLFGRPLVFFATVFNGESFAQNRTTVHVQRMVSKPPQFASAVS